MTTFGPQTATELLKKLTEDGRVVEVRREGAPGSVVWVVDVFRSDGAVLAGERGARAKMLDQALRALVVRGKAEGWLT